MKHNEHMSICFDNSGLSSEVLILLFISIILLNKFSTKVKSQLKKHIVPLLVKAKLWECCITTRLDSLFVTEQWQCFHLLELWRLEKYVEVMQNIVKRVWKILQLWSKLLLRYQTLWRVFYPCSFWKCILKVYMCLGKHITIQNDATFMMSTWVRICL